MTLNPDGSIVYAYAEENVAHHGGYRGAFFSAYTADGRTMFTNGWVIQHDSDTSMQFQMASSSAMSYINGANKLLMTFTLNFDQPNSGTSYTLASETNREYDMRLRLYQFNALTGTLDFANEQS